jgi:hypothetical protein
VHLTLGILRTSQAVSYALSFFQLDGFAVPAPAQVTQTVGRLLAKQNLEKDGQIQMSIITGFVISAIIMAIIGILLGKLDGIFNSKETTSPQKEKNNINNNTNRVEETKQQIQKYSSTVIGFGIAFMHFAIAYFLNKSTIGASVWYILTLPSIAISFGIDYLLLRDYYMAHPYDSISWESYTIPYIMTSSIYYGLVTGFFVSRKRILRFISIVLILLCLIGNFIFCFGILAAQMNA